MRSPGLVAVPGVLAALAAASPAAAQEEGHGHHAQKGAKVSVLFASMAPARVDVLTGDTVTWTNTSVRPHTVTADDGRWSSETLLSDEVYAHRFDAPGSYGYFCVLHPVMRGTVDAHPVLLDTPRTAGAPRRPFRLSGRTAAPAGSQVSIEADAGDGYREVARAEAGADGGFSARVTPATTATYRAVSEDRASPPVRLVVLDRKVRTSVRRDGRRTRIRVIVTPPARPGHVVLQARLPERFGWWPIRTARLNRSQATFVLRGRRAALVRVVLTLADQATALAVGRTFRIGVPAPGR